MTSVVPSGSFQDAVLFAAGVMVLKFCVTHFLKIRCSLITGRYTQPDDAKNSAFMFLGKLFKPMMFAYGPLLVIPAKLDSWVRSCLEGELPVIFLASLIRSPSSWMTPVLYYFTYFRLAHWFTFCILPMQPFRTLAYLPGFAIMVLFGVVTVFYN